MSTDPSPEPRVLDPQVLESLRSLQEPGDPDFALEIVQLFVADSAKRLALVHDTAARGELPALGEIAHLVKGSAGLIGAERMVSAALQLEQAARQGVRDPAAAPSPATIVSLVDQLAHAFAEVRGAFAKLGMIESGAEGAPGTQGSKVP